MLPSQEGVPRVRLLGLHTWAPSPFQLAQTQARPQPTIGGVRTHKGLFVSTCPRTSACAHRCLVDGADVRHKSGQVHSFSFTCPCWLSIGQSCPTGQLTP